jgi:hypothetical protein
MAGSRFEATRSLWKLESAVQEDRFRNCVVHHEQQWLKAHIPNPTAPKFNVYESVPIFRKQMEQILLNTASCNQINAIPLGVECSGMWLLSLGEWYPTFRRTVMPPYSGSNSGRLFLNFLTLKTEVPQISAHKSTVIIFKTQNKIRPTPKVGDTCARAQYNYFKGCCLTTVSNTKFT